MFVFSGGLIRKSDVLFINFKQDELRIANDSLQLMYQLVIVFCECLIKNYLKFSSIILIKLISSINVEEINIHTGVWADMRVSVLGLKTSMG